MNHIRFTLAKQRREDFIRTASAFLDQATYSLVIGITPQAEVAHIECRFIGDLTPEGLAQLLEATAQAIRNGELLNEN